MRGTNSVPDLSLKISLPNSHAGKPLHGAGDRSSTSSDSGSSLSELSHENNFFNKPLLSLGFDHHHHHQRHSNMFQPQIYGRDFKRSSASMVGLKRSIRAPRMRWTSTLHAHFVHAVQLLGGHESIVTYIFLFFFLRKTKMRDKTNNQDLCLWKTFWNQSIKVCGLLVGRRSNAQISVGADECEGSNPSACQESLAGPFLFFF